MPKKYKPMPFPKCDDWDHRFINMVRSRQKVTLCINHACMPWPHL
jgi:hypothetical protein